jgi:hypothetical protein
VYRTKSYQLTNANKINEELKTIKTIKNSNKNVIQADGENLEKVNYNEFILNKQSTVKILIIF